MEQQQEPPRYPAPPPPAQPQFQQQPEQPQQQQQPFQPQPQQHYAQPPQQGYPLQQPIPDASSLPQIEKSIREMEERGMQGDPRYHQMVSIAQRIRGGHPPQPPPPQPQAAPAPPPPPPEAQQETPQPTPADVSEANRRQLKAQIGVYRLLSRQARIPGPLKLAATNRTATLLPEPYAFPLKTGDGKELPYSILQVLSLHQQRSSNRLTQMPKPAGIEPTEVLKERENRLANRIGHRIGELEGLTVEISPELRTKLEIELRMLRLLPLQRQVRHEVVVGMRRDTTLETALNPRSYRRTKKQSLREARVTEKLEKQQKMEQERKRRQEHQEWLNAIVTHAKEFKDFHRNNLLKTQRMKKAVVNYHANSERERKKEEDRREKDRMLKLMQEDEEGYRQLLDKKKDKRLVHLLEQTDSYIGSITNLVREHQQSEKKRKKDEKRAERMVESQRRLMSGENSFIMDESMLPEENAIRIRDMATGRILGVGEGPKPGQNLDDWITANPGFEVLSREGGDEDSDDDQKEKKKESEKKDGAVVDLEGLTEEERNRAIIQKAQHEDDEYAQHQDDEMKAKSYYAITHAISEEVNEQPQMLKHGQLKPYQVKGLEWLVSLYNNNLNGILADEMGLGKTIQTISLVCYLMEVKKINGPFLIIVPLSTLSNWVMEFDKWGPDIVKLSYKGNPQLRKNLAYKIRHSRFNVLLTTYEYVIKDKATLAKVHWKYMVIDEGHRMKNHHCKLTQTLNTYYIAPHRLLLTGTPLQNKLPELWALLNFLLPTIFKSVSTFEQWFNAPFATTGEKVELNAEESMLIIRRLHKVLRPFLLRRLKKEVESQLPDKVEYLLKCELSGLQRFLYSFMQKGVLIDGNTKANKSLMNTVMHLRKLCNHPFLFEEIERSCTEYWGKKKDEQGFPLDMGPDLFRVSGKFELLDRMLPKLQKSGHRVLMFCQMTQAMNILEDFFRYKGICYLRLDGSTKPDERGDLLKDFNDPNSPYFLFLLSTRAGGLGLNLQTADTVIIFDSDWNPHQDMQAQDRAHRIGQKREVRVLRLMCVNSVEEKILAAARYKLNVDEKVIQAGMFDNSSTSAVRRQFLKAILTQETDDEDDEVPDDESLNQMLARSEEEFDLFQSMDMDRRQADAMSGHRKPRLVTEDEIPPSIKTSAINFTKRAEEDEGLTATEKMLKGSEGKRSRREVNYGTDLMSEREWLKEMGEEIDEDEALEEELEQQAAANVASTSASGRKKRGPGSRGGRSARRVGRPEDEEEEEPRSKRRRGASRKLEKGEAEAFAKIANAMIGVLLQYEDSEERNIAAPFVQLPSRREMPEYYDQIRVPMDFHKIKKKIKEGKYANMEEVGEDFGLLCTNAQEFNVEGSDIHNDAILLHKVWASVMARKSEFEATMSAKSDAREGTTTPVGPSPTPSGSHHSEDSSKPGTDEKDGGIRRRKGSSPAKKPKSGDSSKQALNFDEEEEDEEEMEKPVETPKAAEEEQ